MIQLTERQRKGRSLFKRFIYSQLAFRDAIMVFFAKTKPLVHFIVEAEPPSIYWNFEVKADRLDDFAAAVDCTMPLAPLRCLEGEEPFYCLTLNMYRVSGLANGIRAEWSTYVHDAGGTVRYMVIEANADSGAVDSVNMITTGGECTHVDDAGTLTSDVLDSSDGRFHSVIDSVHEGETCRADREWIEANDYIYWRNGVCDRTFYDSGLANAKAHLIEPARCKINDATRFAELVEPTPRHTVVFENAIEFAMSPWWNIRDRDLVK